MKVQIEMEYGEASKVADLVETHIQELRVKKNFIKKHNHGKAFEKMFDKYIKEYQAILNAIRKELG